jgi:hypothetical protein
MPTVSLTDYTTQASDIERRRKMADMLQQESMKPLATNEMAGGYVLPISWTQGLAKALQGYAGMQGQRKATEESQALAQSRNQALAQALGGMPTGTPGTAGVPEQTYTATPADAEFGPANTQVGETSTIPAQIGASPKPATMADNASWLAKLGQIGPDAVAMGGTVLGMQQKQDENAANRDARTMDRIMALDASAQNAALSREERAARSQESADLRRELQKNQQDFQNFMAGQATMDRANQNRQASADRLSIANTRNNNRPMSATSQRELIQTDEEVQGGNQALEYMKAAKEINEKAMGGFGSGTLATVGSVLPNAMRPETVDATLELDNILQNSALPQLKAIFGGMPTEGERKILLEVQGSSSKPASVRKTIFDRAEGAIRARLKFSQDKAKSLREGTYFSGDGGVNQGTQTPTTPTVPTVSPQDQQALQWANSNPNDPRAAAIKQRLGR